MSLNGSPKWMYNAGGGSFYDHTIDQSLRLDHTSGEYLTISSASPTATDRKKVTINCWVKRAAIAQSGVKTIFHGTGNGLMMQFFAADTLYIYDYNAGSGGWQITSPQVFRDVSAWYHFCMILDSTQSTASDRAKLYINGELQDFSTWTVGGGASRYPTQNTNFTWHTGSDLRIGSVGDAYDLGGYIAEFISVDGQNSTISQFGESSNGIWKPVDTSGLTLGNAGFHLDFADSSDVGNDIGANNIDFTATRVSGIDVVKDTPTNNFCTLNETSHGTRLGTVSEGGLKIATSTNNRAVHGTMSLPSSGKWYYEVRVVSYASGGGTYLGWGSNSSLGYDEYASSKGIFFSGYNEQVLSDNAGQSGGYGSNGTNVASNGDIYSILLDVDNSRFYYAKNGTYFNSANPASGTGGLDVTATLAAAITDIVPTITRGGSYNETYYVNFGQDGTFGGAITAGDNADGNGHGNFKYAVPSGFLSLCSSNLPNPAKVADPLEGEQASDYFVTTLYTGTNSTNEKNIGFAPDLLWFKHRNGSSDHVIYDSIRGANSGLVPNNANGQNTSANSSQDLMSFDNDGFTVGVGSQFGSVNSPGHTIAAWSWKGGGTASSNSNGSITSSVSANTDAGFSVVSYTGNGGSSATVGHGLTQAPDCIWLKHRTAGEGWVSFWNTPAMGPTKFLGFNSTGAASTSSGEWNNTAPTNTVFTIGNQGRVNTNTATYIAYCFHNVEGYCKVGQYTGNSATDGPMVYCGFRPAWILIRRTASGSDWCIYDNKRLGYNVDNNIQRISAASEQTDDDIDLYSNGFKFRRSSTNFNGSGNDHVFIAFAEQPFKYATAR